MSDDDHDVDTGPAATDPAAPDPAAPDRAAPDGAADPATDLPFASDGAGRDCFAPPAVACECYCLHCRRTFMSSAMWFQRIRNPRGEALDGFWMCPTPNCDGKGFSFDIFPTDPDHPANDGWFSCDEFDDEEQWLDDDEDEDPAVDVEGEYDPDEPQYQQLDELSAEEDDIEGEEWKYGLEPGQRPGGAADGSEGMLQELEEEARYDAPDERPREIVWEEPPAGTGLNEDDIPF